MKNIFSLLMMVVVVGTFTATAQKSLITVNSSADCTNLKTEFKVPDGKLAKLVTLTISPNFTSCNSSSPATTSNYAMVYKLGSANLSSANSSKTRNVPLYKKTISSNGNVTESCPIHDVVLQPGVYVLELSKAPNVGAKLEIYIQ